MRHGIELRCGFRTGDGVSVTSRRLCLDRMPGVVTGDVSLDCGYRVRVRVVAPWSTNVIFSVWAKPEELAPRKGKR